MSGRTTLNELKAKEREARINLILDAAERVFATKPFDSVSMREIADEAGMATSSIYTYFPHQETLFVEACVRDHKDLIKELQISINDNSKQINVGELIHTYIGFYEKNVAFYRMMTLFMSKGDLSGESMDKINEIVRRILDLFDDTFKGSGYKKSTRYLAHFFLAALNGIVVTFRKFPNRTDEEIFAHMRKLGAVLEEMMQNSFDN